MDAEHAAAGQAISRSRGDRFRLLAVIRNVLTASATWAVIGVPVAALLSLEGLVLLLTGRFGRGVIVGLVLGAVQGLWLTVGGRVVEVEDSRSDWPGAGSGAVLGLLGFPAVFSRLNGIDFDYRQLAWLAIAVVCGGMVAGVLSHRVIAAYGPWDPPTRGRSAAVAAVLVLALGVADYRLYWSGFVEKLPVPAVSHKEVASIAAGNAHGSQWTGCYEYTAANHSNTNSGRLMVQQADGELQVRDSGDLTELRGRVEADGRFRVASEREFHDGNGSATRVLLEGRFSGDSAIFTKRLSMATPQMTLSRRLSGTARRATCPCSNVGPAGLNTARP
jgi:hypothetical protein